MQSWMYRGLRWRGRNLARRRVRSDSLKEERPQGERPPRGPMGSESHRRLFLLVELVLELGDPSVSRVWSTWTRPAPGRLPATETTRAKSAAVASSQGPRRTFRPGSAAVRTSRAVKPSPASAMVDYGSRAGSARAACGFARLILRPHPPLLSSPRIIPLADGESLEGGTKPPSFADQGAASFDLPSPNSFSTCPPAKAAARACASASRCQ